ncbi:uncharacterized protein ATNIH1004_001382 [Aspergillus tanneri]|uniref:Elongator complex protein 5 n=1 Tax=Aspergillus tanneri TaxID=1220188 RepID=A0A5M9N047_9EURO|nr:uncharacterized protein ATNIH1004_001382 [Aspergillus tanneri]KAA8652478.1 hypothetical protein ATNIH1004_001382 [Aspergillus tanneri]
MGTIPQIYLDDRVMGFLQYICDRDSRTALLIICSTKDVFLGRLVANTCAQPNKTTDSHQLLTKTLGLLSKSTRIKLAFCPTLEHLRAYISVIHLKNGSEQESIAGERKRAHRPLLAILDLVALHLSTSEFSAQGLSRTFAAAVETSSREQMDLVLCECQDSTGSDNDRRGGALWHVYVPLLNSSVRTGRDESTWGGRTVPVKQIAQRWFEFSSSDSPTTSIAGL